MHACNCLLAAASALREVFIATLFGRFEFQPFVDRNKIVTNSKERERRRGAPGDTAAPLESNSQILNSFDRKTRKQ